MAIVQRWTLLTASMQRESEFSCQIIQAIKISTKIVKTSGKLNMILVFTTKCHVARVHETIRQNVAAKIT